MLFKDPSLQFLLGQLTKCLPSRRPSLRTLARGLGLLGGWHKVSCPSNKIKLDLILTQEKSFTITLNLNKKQIKRLQSNHHLGFLTRYNNIFNSVKIFMKNSNVLLQLFSNAHKQSTCFCVSLGCTVT